MRFSIDTSAILDGWTRHYPREAFPGLWQHLEELIESGHLRASEEVRHELAKREDEALDWGLAKAPLTSPARPATPQPAQPPAAPAPVTPADTAPSRRAPHQGGPGVAFRPPNASTASAGEPPSV